LSNIDEIYNTLKGNEDTVPTVDSVSVTQDSDSWTLADTRVQVNPVLVFDRFIFFQYVKGQDGVVLSVSVTIGFGSNASGVVIDSGSIDLDVSEFYLRAKCEVLKQNATVGPFTVAVDPSSARAKFKKKTSELTVEIKPL
jgi:hypothetical protein